MKLIAVTPEYDIEDEHKYISLLIADGFIVHCRKPDKSNVEMANYLRSIPADFRNSLAIHDHHELAEDMGIKRLHFPEAKRKETILDEEKYGNFILTSSVHDRKELTEGNWKMFSYVFCGPVYDGISKSGYKGNDQWQQNVNGLASVEKIAISGMKVGNLVQVSKWGYDGIAFSGYLWEDPSGMESRIDKIKEVWIKDLTH